MMIPARITPSITAITLRLKSQSRIDAAKVPVQAPVPGSGIPTKVEGPRRFPYLRQLFQVLAPTVTFFKTPGKEATN